MIPSQSGAGIVFIALPDLSSLMSIVISWVSPSASRPLIEPYFPIRIRP